MKTKWTITARGIWRKSEEIQNHATKVVDIAGIAARDRDPKARLHASGIDTHCDSITSRAACLRPQRRAAAPQLSAVAGDSIRNGWLFEAPWLRSTSECQRSRPPPRLALSIPPGASCLKSRLVPILGWAAAGAASTGCWQLQLPAATCRAVIAAARRQADAAVRVSAAYPIPGV